TAAGYIVGVRSIENENNQSILLNDVYINNPSQRLIYHFESLEIAKEQVIGHKKLSSDDAQNLISRWEESYFTTS
ncbi:hypothetical protein KQ729_15530, partial [Listeria monocytogenes]|nr:hypothetical protein [Listeria monocytogenes]